MTLDIALDLKRTFETRLHIMKERFFVSYDCIRPDYFKDWKILEEKINWINKEIERLRL